jgi:hypothetical protein
MPADEPVTRHHAEEYVKLLHGGAKPGGDTMRQARANVAGKFAGTASEDSAIEAAGGGPEDPVADFGAVANTLRRAAASGAGRAGSGAVSAARSGQSGLSSLGRHAGTPGQAAQTITRLVWAIALGLIALEVASEATGQFWNFNLKGPGLQKQPYQPLYPSQASLEGSPLPASALPGFQAPGMNVAGVGRVPLGVLRSA